MCDFKTWFPAKFLSSLKIKVETLKFKATLIQFTRLQLIHFFRLEMRFKYSHHDSRFINYETFFSRNSRDSGVNNLGVFRSIKFRQPHDKHINCRAFVTSQHLRFHRSDESITWIYSTDTEVAQFNWRVELMARKPQVGSLRDLIINSLRISSRCNHLISMIVLESFHLPDWHAIETTSNQLFRLTFPCDDSELLCYSIALIYCAIHWASVNLLFSDLAPDPIHK